ncbi:hypothetical protein [Micromonospora sp. NPDC002575]|uniref:hypothetical protein n=1 Tax=Micromonospora sp. NPDC002575 TaxID=3364222 RepID=UPI0036854CD2
MARFLCWLIGRRPLTGDQPETVPQPVTGPQPVTEPVPEPDTTARAASRASCTPGRRPRRRPLAGTALPRSPWNRSADR